MVRLLEFEVKDLLKKYNLPIPRQFEESHLNDPSIYPVVIKSQVPIGGRGKLGGIQFADNLEEAMQKMGDLRALEIKGYRPESLLIEEKLQVLKEYYCGFIVNRNEKNINYIFSESGGVDIEEITEKGEGSLIVEPLIPMQDQHDEIARKLVKKTNISSELKTQFEEILRKLLRFIIDYDAELFETNPLIETQDHQLLIADARMNIDDNSLYRHQEYKKNLSYYLKPLELQARELGMSYVELKGDIGVICNGAGLVMGTIDAVQSYGVRAANFLDVGGGADAERMYQALKLITTNKAVKVILINIIGGITRCDEIAKGLIEFLEEKKEISFALRLIGTNEREGQELLRPFNITINRTLDDSMQDLLKKL